MPKSENLVYWELVQVSVVACTGRTDTRDKLLQFYASSRLLLSSTVFWCSSRGTVTRWSNSTGILDEINHIIVSWLDVVMHILLAHVHSVELCIKFNAIMGAAQWLSTKAANPISRAAFVWSRCLQQPLEETDKIQEFHRTVMLINTDQNNGVVDLAVGFLCGPDSVVHQSHWISQGLFKFLPNFS